MTDSRTPLHAAATFGHVEVFKLLITKGSDPNVFHDHGFHAIFQLFFTAKFLKGAEKLAVVDWVIRKQELFEFDVHAVDVLHGDLSQVIIQTQTCTSIPGGIQHCTLVDALITKNLCLDNQDFEGSTALHEASKCGRQDIVELLLNGFATPTIKDNRGRTPLHYAADLGHVAIVRRFLQENIAGIDDSDATGWKPLRLAVKGDHLDTVKLLIDLGAHVHYTHLTDAVRFDAKASFDFLLTIGVKLNAQALHYAISGENLHYLRSFILGGVDPNLPIPFPAGYSLLLTVAAQQQRAPAVQLLLSMGANVNLRSSQGCSALLWAVSHGNLEMVDILLKAGAVTHDLDREGQTMNLIVLATRRGYADIAEMLCKAGAPKPAADQLCANTSFDMHTAACQNRVGILKELIRQGEDVNKISDVGYPAPLQLACGWGSSEVALLLIDAGPDLGSQAEFHPPPLFCAAGAGLTNVFEVLLQKGADTNQLNFQGQTAVHYVLVQDLVGDQTRSDQAAWIVEKLIRAGTNVNIVDMDRRTALGTACWRGFTSIAKMLLDAGAEINIPSLENRRDTEINDIDPNNDAWFSDNKTRYLPLDLAAKAGHEDIVQLLLANGANWRSLKQEKTIATSHAVLVKHWFADDDDGDEDITLLGCEPPEAQLKVPSAQGALIVNLLNTISECLILIRVDPQESNDSRQRTSKQQTHKTKKLHRHLIDSGLLILTGLNWIESCILHLCIGMASIIVVSLLLLHHKVPFSLLQEIWPILRVLLWAIVIRFILKNIFS